MLNRWKRPAADFAADLLAWGLKAGGTHAYRDVVNALWERQPVYAEFDIQLVLPQPVAPDPAERPVVERILAAYRRAKLAQARQTPRFQPAGGWKKVVESAYVDLIEGGTQGDLPRFHHFLANFGAWDQQTGIEESQVFRKVAASARKRTHFEQRVMGQLLHWWKTFESDGRDLSALSLPRFGNQGGVLVDGQLIVPNAIFSEFYGRLLAGFVATPRPIVAELGGGYGRLFYFLAQHLPAFTYLGIDLPEILCCASYFLMLAFPEKRFLLFGEGDLAETSWQEFDFVLLPAWEIGKLPGRSIELFINENSLGVMPPDACQFYVREMCRTAEAIWHRNHEVRRNPFEDGTYSLVNREYPIDREQFRQIVRYGDIERFVGQTLATSKNDMYWYYFQRKLERD